MEMYVTRKKLRSLEENRTHEDSLKTPNSFYLLSFRAKENEMG